MEGKKNEVVVKNPVGKPAKKIGEIIDVDNLPSRFRTSEELRGYILHKTNGGREVVDEIIRIFKSRKTTKTLKRDFAKILLELIKPEQGQSMTGAFESPDGQFVFRWQNEVKPDA